jgi:hypothetical protein
MMLATYGRIIFGAAVGILVVEGENFHNKKSGRREEKNRPPRIENKPHPSKGH